MRHRYAYTETVLFAITATVLLVTAVDLPYSGILNEICRSNATAKRCEVIRAMLALYGSGVAVVSVVSFLTICRCGGTLCAHCLRCIRYIGRETSETFRRLFETGQLRHQAFWLATIVAVGAAVRSFFLAQPMRYDEAYTFLQFVNGGVFDLFYYPLPNNHVFHTILVRISVEFFGAHPVAIRLPAFVAGLVNIPLTFALARSLNAKPKAGFMAASMMAVFPYLILFDTMARGYSLFTLMFLCLVATALRIASDPSPRLSVMMAMPVSLGLFVMPSFLFPFTGVMLWLALVLLSHGHKPIWILTRVMVPCAIATAMFTAILYTPVFIASNGIQSVVANRFVQGEPFHQFLSSLSPHIFSTARIFSRSIPMPLLVTLVILLIYGIYSTARERRSTTLLLLPMIFIGALVVLFSKHAIPFARTWIYLLPLVFIFVDAGLAGIPWLRVLNLKKSLLALSVCAAAILMTQNTISLYPDTGHFPEAPILADILAQEMAPQDSLNVRRTAGPPMRFYMKDKKFSADNSVSDASSVTRNFFVVKPSRYSITEMTERNVRLLVSIGDAELYVAEMEKNTKTFQQGDARNEE